MNSTEGKDRGGQDYWTAVCRSYPVKQDLVVGTGKVAVAV
jgi:hypothetical protein